jgi:excinuclease ABC subunit A
MQTIKIRGARTHNLANIDLDLPRDKLIVVTGLSGSGKSSLAFDTIYAEGKSRTLIILRGFLRRFQLNRSPPRTIPAPPLAPLPKFMIT